MSGAQTAAELLEAARQGDNEACRQVLEENEGLVWSIVRRYYGRGVEPDDLYQLGCLGFLKAVRGYDPAYGTQFSTYAVPKISGEIRRFLRDDGAIKVSRSLKEQSAQIKSLRNRLTNAYGREPTIQELATHSGLSAEEIAMAETATREVESIQRETNAEGFTLENVLTDTETEDRMLEKMALRQAIDRLGEREQMVIRLRYYHGLTQDRVAKVLGVSQVQVSRIEKKAIGHLREQVE